jgi:hypothetical protein
VNNEASYELILTLKYEPDKKEDLFFLLKSYANSILISIENTKVEAIIKQYKSRGFFSKYRIKLYSEYLVKGIEINNIQHHFSICFSENDTVMKNTMENYIETSQTYNLGLNEIKEII